MDKLKSINTINAFLILVAIAFFLFLHAGDNKTKIINYSDRTITQISVAPETTENWQKLDIGQKAMEQDDSLYVALDLSEECFWDVKVVDKEKNEYFIYGLDLCEENTIVIYFDENMMDDEEE